MRNRVSCTLLLCLLLAGCEDRQDQSLLRATVTGVEIQNSELKRQVAELHTTQAATDRDVTLLKAMVMNPSTLIIDPVTSQGYEMLNLGLSSIAISIDDIAAYGDGSKVSITIGNPSSATYMGLTGQVTYGASSSEVGAVSYDEWEKAQKKTSVEIPENVLPARWTKSTLVLPGIPPNKLARIELKLSRNRIQLFGGK